MFAVIKTGGKQYLVKENQELVVDRLNTKLNTEIPLEIFGIFDDEKKTVSLGSPLKEKAKAKVIEQGKEKKKMVFRYKSKTRQRKKKGHRQPFTKVQITKIAL